MKLERLILSLFQNKSVRNSPMEMNLASSCMNLRSCEPIQEFVCRIDSVPRSASSSPPVRQRARRCIATHILALLALASCCCCHAAPRGMPGKTRTLGRSSGGPFGGQGQGLRASTPADEAEEEASGMIIEDEDHNPGADEQTDISSGDRATVPCSHLEFPEEMISAAFTLMAEGRGQEGVHCLRVGARQEPQPDFAEFFEALGTLEQQHGDADAAREAWLQVLEMDAEHAHAVLNLGNWHTARGEDEDSPVPHNNLGLALMRRGDKEKSLAAFTEGLRVSGDPQAHAMLYNNLGIVYKDSGEQATAIATFRKAQHALPSVEAAINICSTLNDMGAFVEAESEMRDTFHLLPNSRSHATALRVLATSLAFQDRLVAAADLLVQAQLDRDTTRSKLSEVAHEMAGKGKGEEAIELMSAAAGALSEAEDWYHLGMMLVEMHRNRLGMRAYQTALRLDPLHERCLSAGAVHLYKMGKFHDAEKMFERQIKVSSDDSALSDANNGLGAAIEMTHSRLEKSVAAFRQAVELNESNEPAFFSLIHLLGRICDWREYDQMMAKARRFIDSGSAGGLGPIFALAYPLSPQQMCTVTHARAREAVANIQRFAPEFIAWKPDYGAPLERLGLAVVSADFNARPVGQLVQSVFKLMDRSRFEIFCFMLEVHDNSQVLVNIANSVDEWFWVKGLSPLEVARMVNNEQPHVLVDLNGFTDGGRHEIGALKPAPVSVNYLGFPYTLTIPGFDYILADRLVLPPEQHPECFTERVAWMPNMYMVNDHRQSQQGQIAGDFTLENATNYSVPHRDAQVVFANFNHLQKLGPATFALWIRVMRSVPLSLLWLLKFPKEAESHLIREFKTRNIATTRLHLSDKFASDVHLNVKRGASILLDTLEYNAHVSGLDALWAGLPLVTMAGANMARRCGASFLRTSRVPQLLARTPEDYVALSVRLATHPPTCARIRHKVEEERVNGRLFDTKQWVAEFEVMLRLMWEVAADNGRYASYAHAASSAQSRKPLPNIIVAGYTGWET